MKKFKTLDKGWKEILFAFSAFGPNLLMGIMGAYYSDAVNPAALSVNEAAAAMKLPVGEVFCLGTMLVPIIVSICCLAGFFLAKLLCKNYEPREIAEQLNMLDKYEEKIDLFPVVDVKEEKTENVGVNIGLWVLSGSIFSYIWSFGMRKQINEMSDKKIGLIHWILSILLPPYGAYLYYSLSKQIDAKCNELGIETKDRSVLCAIFGGILLTFVPLAILQSKLNKIHKAQ